MNWLANWWRNLWTSKETALLRAENERLAETNAVLEEELASARGEIRGLVNSALSQAGVTPLPPVNEAPMKPIQRVRHFTPTQKRRVDWATADKLKLLEAKEMRERFEKKNPNERQN